MDEQGSFRSGRGVYRSGICSEADGRAMFMVFTDLEKAYDYMCTEKLWRVCLIMG